MPRQAAQHQPIRRGVRIGLAGAVVAAALAVASGPATALPPGGAVDITNGAKVTISAKRVVAGGKIRVVGTNWKSTGSRVYGRAVVTVKIDDADILATFPIRNKRFAGWVTIPRRVKPGNHWLRFLAAKPATSIKSPVIRVTKAPVRKRAR